MRILFYKVILGLKKIVINILIFTITYLLLDFIFATPYIAIPITIYFTVCVNIFLKNHSNLYVIPYDDMEAYLKALENYNKNNIEYVKGELVNDYVPNYNEHKIFIYLHKIVNILPHRTDETIQVHMRLFEK